MKLWNVEVCLISTIFGLYPSFILNRRETEWSGPSINISLNSNKALSDLLFYICNIFYFFSFLFFIHFNRILMNWFACGIKATKFIWY